MRITDHEVSQCLALLCDAMKRIELAITEDNMDDRDYYLEEAAERRKRVEKCLLK